MRTLLKVVAIVATVGTAVVVVGAARRVREDLRERGDTFGDLLAEAMASAKDQVAAGADTVTTTAATVKDGVAGKFRDSLRTAP